MSEPQIEPLPLRTPREPARAGRRVVLIGALSILVAFAAALVAQGLTLLIFFVTNLAFYGRLSVRAASPAGNGLGWFVIVVPVLGGIVVGLMARYGSRAIRGHGIPEAREEILFNESRLPPRGPFLKPASAAPALRARGPAGGQGPVVPPAAGPG